MWFLYPLVQVGRKRKWKKQRQWPPPSHPLPPYFLLQMEFRLSPQCLTRVQVCSGRADWQNEEWQAKLRAGPASTGNKQEK